jgi:hypothetical protein
MKKIICLLVALGIVLSTVGCINPMLPFVAVLEENNGGKVVSFFEEIERVVPPPSFIKSYLETTTIGTGEDKDIFDFEDCDWDVQKYTTLGSYNVRSDKGWFINIDYVHPAFAYFQEIEGTPSIYVGHGNHKLYDDAHGLQGYYTPSSLRVSMFSGKGGQSGGTYYSTYHNVGYVKVSSPLFVMKENYVTTYMNYDVWEDLKYYYYGGVSHRTILIKTQLIDATSGNVIDETILTSNQDSGEDNLTVLEGMWRPIILNGSAYKGRTVFIRFDIYMHSGIQDLVVIGARILGCGSNFDVYFDEIHFSDEYGDYISYYTSVPPVPNYSYTISDKTVAVNGTSSTDNGVITEYRWSWGDGTQSFGAIDTHQYSADNNYTVQLCVTDDEQMTVCIQKVLNVNTTPTTNTVVTGTTTPDNSTTTVVTPPVTTPVATTPPTSATPTASTSTNTTTTTTTSNPFPYWGFFIFCVGVLLIFGIGYYIIKKPKIKGLGKKTKRKVK